MCRPIKEVQGVVKKQARIKIFRSTIDLMEEYAMDEITIKMICAYSGINRSTFYVYFLDKYDLFEQIQTYHKQRYQRLMNIVYNNFDKILKDNQKLLQFFRIVFMYIYRYQRFFRAVFVTHPQKEYVIDMAKFTYQSYEKLLDDYTHVTDNIYYVNYLIGGQFGVIHTWLRRNCDETPEAMAQTMLTNTIKMRK